MDKKKPYSADRWHCIPAYKVVGYEEVMYEEKVEAEKALLELKLITQTEYNEEIEKIKKEYGIKE